MTNNEYQIPNTPEYMPLPEVPGIFSDAVITDESGSLVFCSFWGRDTSIRELQARLTLGSQEGGMTSFHLIHTEPGCSDGAKKLSINVGNIDAFEQSTGRVNTSIFGELVHCWLFKLEVVKPDLANHRAIMIFQDDSNIKEYGNLWHMVKMICPIPLLDHWEQNILDAMNTHQMITKLNGINLHAYKIVIDEDVMSEIIKRGCFDGVFSTEAS